MGAIAAAAVGCRRKTRPGFAGFAFVANAEGQAVAAVDLSAFSLVRHVRLEASPEQLVGAQSRGMVYALTPSTGSVHEISARQLVRTRSVTLGSAAIAMQSRGGTLWVLLRAPRQLVELKLDTMRAERRIALPADAVDFDLSIEAPRALISLGDSVLVADLESQKLSRIDCGRAVGMARFRKDGRQWIAASREENLLSIYDTASGRLVVRLPLAVRPQNLCFKADGGQLFVTGPGSDAVAIVYPYSTEVAETVLAGRTPGAMAASPVSADTPEFLFVTNAGSSQVTILNIETRKVVSVTQVGARPSHVVVTPDNQYALVLNEASGDMAVLMIQSAAKRTRFPAALLTMVPVGSKPVSAVVQAV